MIGVRNLEFAYGDSFHLTVEELSIGKCERVAWLGPSGSGKTTLLQIAAGILVPRQGTVQACDTNLTQLSPAERRDFRIANVGLVFQEFELLDYLDVLDNVLLAFRISGTLKLTNEIRSRAKELVSSVGLKDVIHRRVDRLSHGQRQRIAVCRALVAHPKLVLADEPTANLDPDNKARILDLLDHFVEQADATLVVVTHDREVSARFDRVFQMDADHSDASGVTSAIRECESDRDG